MNHHVRRALVATTTGLALAVPMLALPSLAPAAGAAVEDRIVNHAFKADAAGARLIVNNVEVLSLNQSNAPLPCTRTVGESNQTTFPLATPEGSPIQLSGATNTTRSYRDGKRVGSRAVSQLAPIKIGDSTGETTGGVPTPEISIKGLTTVADAFRTPRGYGHKETISRLNLDIDLLPGSDVDQPLQDLLDAIETGLLQPVLDVLETTVGAAPIKIPGLGSIALGFKRGSADAHGAQSHASALRIVVNATEERQKLFLGDTQARINGPAPAVVFGSTSHPMQVDVNDGLLRLGAIQPFPLPCAGTAGKVQERKLGSASVLLPEGLLASVKGVQYRQMGDQKRNGFAEGFQVSRIGSFAIPALDLEITGISSRTEGVQKAGTRQVRKSSQASVAKVMYQGQEIKLLRPGRTLEVEGLGFLTRKVVTDGSDNGYRVVALQLRLADLPVTFDLGISGLWISRT